MKVVTAHEEEIVVPSQTATHERRDCCEAAGDCGTSGETWRERNSSCRVEEVLVRDGRQNNGHGGSHGGHGWRRGRRTKGGCGRR